MICRMRTPPERSDIVPDSFFSAIRATRSRQTFPYPPDNERNATASLVALCSATACGRWKPTSKGGVAEGR